jgi:hypothetical protein
MRCEVPQTKIIPFGETFVGIGRDDEKPRRCGVLKWFLSLHSPIFYAAPLRPCVQSLQGVIVRSVVNHDDVVGPWCRGMDRVQRGRGIIEPVPIE